MKKNYLLFFFSFFVITSILKASPGDTTKIIVFDKLSMNHYGNFDTWVKLPSTDKKYQRVWLKYTIGCESNGQCEWDYTNTLYAREHTKKNDSTLMQAPSFKVNGKVQDSLNFSSVPTYVNVFNANTKQTDSVRSTTILLSKYSDITHPLTLTDTIRVYPVNYYRYIFDTTGIKIDSFLVPIEQTIKLVNTPYYNVFEVVNNYELGRMITPYAKFFPKTFQYEYAYDVTDLITKLHDSVEIRMLYSGYSWGFVANVKFEFVEGVPTREAYRVDRVYEGYLAYGNANNPIEKYLVPKSFSPDSLTKTIKLRLTVTGHGGEKNENCSEFCAKNLYLKLNENLISKQLIWKACGFNTISAQGGTWVYDRANWCPGEQVKVYEYELDYKNGMNTVDLDIDSFVANGSAGYQVNAQLVYYKDFASQNDVSLEKIKSPSTDFWYSNINPECGNGLVTIKNFGAQTLNSLDIYYQVGDNAPQKRTWYGVLPTGKDTDVVLYNINFAGASGNKTFKAWVDKPNGQADGNALNDVKTNNFTITPQLPNTFVIEMTTNKVPSDNRIVIKNLWGQVMFDKQYSVASKLHKDTIVLGYGCYTFELTDLNGDGLSFFANSAGSGSCRLMKFLPNYSLIKNFNADFGSRIVYNFTAGAPLSIEESKPFGFDLYPNPTDKALHIDLNTDKGLENAVQVFNIQGQLLKSFNTKLASFDINLEDFDAGMYIVSVKTDDGKMSRKFMKQ